MISALLAPLSAPQADLVTSLPGFDSWPFKLYSGYLAVKGPFTLNDYDELRIHYQFHTSQRDPQNDAVVTWHQGGPGGSSIDVGLFTEMGYFSLSSDGPSANEFAWNKVANMLYLESPAGSGNSAGFSTCVKAGKPVGCKWDDVSQAEAYAHSLVEFSRAFPEFATNPLYLTGESYFGQYGPNTASYILSHAPFNSTLPLKGIAAGNACWGGDETSVACNGPNEERNDVEMYFGKGLVSKKLYEQVQAACDGQFDEPGAACDVLLERVSAEVGPHNVYNIYDNCDEMEERLAAHNKSMRWARQRLRADLAPRSSSAEGGFTWRCGGMAATEEWITRPDVRKALHLDAPHKSSFHYSLSGPASITLWPSLSAKLRVLVYNGDADACVPYKGNEEWIGMLEKRGVLTEAKAWRPWYLPGKRRAPAGYVTAYTPSEGKHDFSFLTIRLAGHMVPTYQPAASLAFISSFLDAKPF